MQTLPKAIRNLIESFERLPGIGPKTAARLAFYLLHVPQHELERFATSLTNLKSQTVTCSICCNISESDPCPICTDGQRRRDLVCVVEQAIDVLSFERTGKFDGVYHVLHGSLNPLQNIGPEEIRIDELVKRVNDGGITEVIMATNPTMEGESTALYITKQIKSKTPDVIVSRLAHGLPVGGDVEYADEVTLGRALEGRRAY